MSRGYCEDMSKGALNRYDLMMHGGTAHSHLVDMALHAR